MYCDVCCTPCTLATPCGHTVCHECKRDGYCQACVRDRVWTKRYRRKRPRPAVLALRADHRPSLQKKRSVVASNTPAEPSYSSLESFCPEHEMKQMRDQKDDARAGARNGTGNEAKRPRPEGTSSAKSEFGCARFANEQGCAEGWRLECARGDDGGCGESTGGHMTRETETCKLDATVNDNVEMDGYDPLLYIPAGGGE